LEINNEEHVDAEGPKSHLLEVFEGGQKPDDLPHARAQKGRLRLHEIES